MRTFQLEQIEEAMECNIGFCVECGAERECCEPDARKYACEECGAMAVYGAEELAIMGLVADDDEIVPAEPLTPEEAADSIR